MEGKSDLSTEKTFTNPNEVIKWLEEQPAVTQTTTAQDIFGKLLAQAAQPKSASGKSCLKLCAFVDQCSKSKSPILRDFTYEPGTALKLFNFYVEWNETEQHRSMRLVLDLLPLLVTQNADQDAASRVKYTILDSLLRIISGKSTKPLLKSAIKALTYLFNKSFFSLDEIARSYKTVAQSPLSENDLQLWKAFFTELLNRMKQLYVCQPAGKLVADIFKALHRRRETDNPADCADTLSIGMWNQWLLEILTANPELLEPIKTYVFVPLFKNDRQASLEYLSEVNRSSPTFKSSELDVVSIFQLAVLEVGKKAGIVDEPGAQSYTISKSGTISLEEETVEMVLVHPSHEVRTLALSLIVSCPSTSRPFSPASLNLLKRYLGSYFADFDAKFRTDTLSKVKDVFKRIRGAIFVLQRSILRAQVTSAKGDALGTNGTNGNCHSNKAQKPVMFKANIISMPESELRQALAEHEVFIRWYLSFLWRELTPTSSYQRHISALKATLEILKIEADPMKPWETPEDDRLFYSAFDQDWVRSLLDLVLDPFEDVRETSASVLKRILSDPHFGKVLQNQSDTSSISGLLIAFLSKADRIASQTGRADKADGVARTYELLYHFIETTHDQISLASKLISTLEDKLSIAERDLGTAVLEAPVHGYFSALCYIWQALPESKFSSDELELMSELLSRIVQCCGRIWITVRDVLCDDSPEGHLPQELEELDGLDTKDLLSYSFRAIHESSNLMRIIVIGTKYRSRRDSVCPSREVFEIIGDLTFEQLSTLRHRGAFATVSLTFATCCQLSKDLVESSRSDESEEALLVRWYQGTLNCIFAQASTTRRSAGIPAMMTAILGADASQPAFSDVLDTLMDISRRPARVSETDGSNLPQVHALNCLKDIFRNSHITYLGKSERYLPHCLELASTCMKSEVWAIRNCGLIFLRSLIDFLLGTNESKAMIESGWDGKATRMPYHKYPALPGVLLNLLEAGLDMMAPTTASSAAESVFPALDIIRRAGPPDELRDELYSYIVRYLASPVWHVREIAARTVCSCLLHEGWLAAIREIIHEAESVTVSVRNNYLHGAFLSLRYVIEKVSEVMPVRLQNDMPQLCQLLRRLATNLAESLANNDYILAAFVETLNLVSKLELSYGLSDSFDATAALDFCKASDNLSTALLRIQLGVRKAYDSIRSGDLGELKPLLCEAAETSIGTAISILESMSEIASFNMSVDLASQLCETYVEVCLRTGAVEPRAISLHNLAVTVEYILDRNQLHTLPSRERFTELWCWLQASSINPNLANAILRASGPIIATITCRMEPEDIAGFVGISSWGSMMADAGLDDKTFDSRFSAAESLRSFFTVVGKRADKPVFLTSLLALYDSLNDDDDEVRDVAAQGVRNILDQNLVPLEAANQLLQWLASSFGNHETFKTLLVYRMAGQVVGSHAHGPRLSDLEPAEKRLAEAMRFDDSLFVIEEQNLFIDEVREARRWKRVFESLELDAVEEWFGTLRHWTVLGMQKLIQLSEKEDGPLGYTSQPAVFAMCSRIILCAVAFSRTGHCPELGEELERLRTVGQSSQFHGLLLEMVDDEQI